MTAYRAMPTDLVRALQAGAPDANGQVTERVVSPGGGCPCRHCLRDIPEGAGMLILAHRPFPSAQPYAETGPIFLCADPCARHDETVLPEIARTRPACLIKGYTAADRILYGTGAIVAGADLAPRAEDLLAREDVAYVHVRSATNNCYQFRIDRT